MEKCTKYIKYKIANCLGYYDLMKLFNVNKWWYNAGKDDDLWKLRMINLYGNVLKCVKSGNLREIYEKYYYDVFSMRNRTFLKLEKNPRKLFVKMFQNASRYIFFKFKKFGKLFAYGAGPPKKHVDSNVKKILGHVNDKQIIYVNNCNEQIGYDFFENEYIKLDNYVQHVKNLYQPNSSHFSTFGYLYYISKNAMNIIIRIDCPFDVNYKNLVVRSKNIHSNVKSLVFDLELLNNEKDIIYIDIYDNLCHDGKILAKNVKKAQCKAYDYTLELYYLDKNGLLFKTKTIKTPNFEIKNWEPAIKNVKDFEYTMCTRDASFILFKNGKLCLQGWKNLLSKKQKISDCLSYKISAGVEQEDEYDLLRIEFYNVNKVFEFTPYDLSYSSLI